MDKLKIFVACHKPCDYKKDGFHLPIHVGRSISKYTKEMSDMIGDDTGDNISDRNPFYSEMTAQYWVWKNYHQSEYVGFCHYRRYFDETLTEDNLDSIFNKQGYDVIMNEPVYRSYTRYNFLSNYICAEDRYIMQKVIKELYPEYYNSFLKYSNGYKDYVCNMFICRKELFDEYAEWIFRILMECEKLIKLPQYTRSRRIFGYISEFLMPVFFIHNKKKIKALPFSNRYGHSTKTPFKNKIKILFKEAINKNKCFIDIKMDPSIEAGLKFDGIIK